MKDSQSPKFSEWKNHQTLRGHSAPNLGRLLGYHLASVHSDSGAQHSGVPDCPLRNETNDWHFHKRYKRAERGVGMLFLQSIGESKGGAGA